MGFPKRTNDNVRMWASQRIELDHFILQQFAEHKILAERQFLKIYRGKHNRGKRKGAPVSLEQVMRRIDALTEAEHLKHVKTPAMKRLYCIPGFNPTPWDIIAAVYPGLALLATRFPDETFTIRELAMVCSGETHHVLSHKLAKLRKAGYAAIIERHMWKGHLYAWRWQLGSDKNDIDKTGDKCDIATIASLEEELKS